MTPDQQATRRGLLEALHEAQQAILARPRGPRMTRDKARLALDAFDDALGQPREDPGQ
jgi:hypothetical protein